MSVLTARNFVDIDLNQVEREKARLELIYSQIAEQTPEVKQQLVCDFLGIIKDPAEKQSARTTACILIGGKRKDLGIVHSSLVVETLRDVVNREFIISKRRGILLRKEISLREMHVLQFAFLQGLLATMLRIDFDKTHQFIESVTDKIR